MELTLYHYVHCPFCVRVRMALGYLGLSYKSVVVPYDDEETPMRLTGVKMLPIMEINSKAMNESLDIIETLDQKNLLKTSQIKADPYFKEFNDLLNKLGSNVHNLAMPYWIYTPEFNDTSRAYFQKKKEAKRGPFKNLVQHRTDYENPLLEDLKALIPSLKPYYHSDTFSAWDIMLAAHLWGLYIVPEFQFPAEVHQYLQRIKEQCYFNYHEDFWK